MDKKVIKFVKDYVVSHLDKSDEMPEFEVYTVWKCKILQNWKYLASTTLPDGTNLLIMEIRKNGCL